MKRAIGRIIDLVILAIGFVALVVALNGCTRSDTVSDAKTDRTTVTKETKLHEGVEPWKETVYREEVSKETAHSEQSRTTSVPAIESLGGLMGGMSTGNPIVDMVLALLGATLAGKGTAKIADKLTKKKAT